jgi:membrane carboxypeptidase/penicillin-binding protein
LSTFWHVQFEFPSIGHIYDAKDETLFEFARECRRIVQYPDNPPIVRDAIIAAEGQKFQNRNSGYTPASAGAPRPVRIRQPFDVSAGR